MTSILLLLAQASFIIDLEAGYYTLGDVASHVRKAGLAVESDASCAGDLYAIRARGVEWTNLRAALETDERLSIRLRDGVWRISRSAADSQREAASAKRYLAAAAQPIHAVYSRAENIIRELDKLPAQDRSDMIVSALNDVSKDPQFTKIKTIVYLHDGRELPFSIICGTASLTKPDAPPRFAQPFYTTLFESPRFLLPSGDIRSLKTPAGDLAALNQEQLAEFTRSVGIMFKLMIDPLTLRCGGRVLAAATGKAFFLSTGMEDVSPPKDFIIAPPVVWTKPEIEGMERRAKHTVYGDLKLANNLVGKSVRASEALLKSAEDSKVNLVHYVSSFTDLTLADVRKMEDTASIGKTSLAWLQQGLLERTEGVYLQEHVFPIRLEHVSTASKVGGIHNVRNELRFLDSLRSSPPSPPAKLFNALLKGERGSAKDLIDHVAQLDLKKWPTSIFSSNYLPFCNPISFQPFAKMLRNSPVLWDRLAKLEPGKTAVVGYGELEPAAIQALHASVIGFGHMCDSGGAWAPPAFLELLLRLREGQDPKLRIQRSGSRYELRMMHDGEAKWRSWVDNVDFAKPYR